MVIIGHGVKKTVYISIGTLMIIIIIILVMIDGMELNVDALIPKRIIIVTWKN
jgi:hypothetical protein